MRKIHGVVLTIFTVLMLSVFVFGCADDGKDGVAGITGTAGCDFDKIFDKELGFCVPHDVSADHVSTHPGDGDPGPQGPAGPAGNNFTTADNCDAGKIWNSVDGSCE